MTAEEMREKAAQLAKDQAAMCRRAAEGFNKMPARDLRDEEDYSRMARNCSTEAAALDNLALAILAIAVE